MQALNPLGRLRAVLTAALMGSALPAGAICDNPATFVKSHTWDDLDASGTTTAGDVLHYTIVFCEPGAGNRSCAFEDRLPAAVTLTPGTLVCTPDPGTASPTTCAEQPAGSGLLVVDYNRMTRNSCVTVTFDAVVNTDPAGDVCNEAVSRVDRTDTSGADCHPPVPAADLEMTKIARAGTVSPGATAVFDIRVHNIGTDTLDSGSLSDTLEPCFVPLGAAGQPCDPAVVQCAGPGCAGAICTYTNGGRGFSLQGFTLTAENRLPGGPDEITVTVNAVAGTTLGPCRNDAETSDPDSPSITSGDTVQIAVVPDLEILKVALAPAVQPNSPVDFQITVRNIGSGTLGSGQLGDALQGCFQPLGPVGQPCDPAVVRCAGAGCAGAVCSYTAGGQGFGLVGFTLAPSDGQPGGPDEIVVTVTAVAGPLEGPCTNTATTQDPDSPLLSAQAVVDIVVFRPDLAIDKTAALPVVAPGAPVDFDIVLQNVGRAAMTGAQVVDVLDPCFAPLGTDLAPCDPGVVRCAGAGCAAVTCTYSNGGLGFTLSAIDLAADDGAPGGPDEVTITVTAVAGPTAGLCNNTAQTSDPDSPSLQSAASVDIATRPLLEIAKTARAATVPPGGNVAFDIVVRNLGSARMAAAQVVDRMEACFAALGLVGDPCDPAVVVCSGAGCAGAVCSYSLGGLGFTYAGLVLEANDGAPGGPDELTITVNAVAGGLAGPCTNTAETADPSNPLITDSATVDIATTATCDLLDSDVTFPPRAPSLATLYVRTCSPTDLRLDRVNTPSVVAGDLADAYDGATAAMRLYQLDCSCANGTWLSKNRATGRVRLTLF